MNPEIEELLEKLRADLDFVAKARVKSGDWSEADIADINRAIRTAIKSQDLVAVANWAKYLADMAAAMVAWGMVIRNAELRIREAAQNKPKEEAQASRSGA